MKLPANIGMPGSLFFTYVKLLLTAIFWGGTFIAGRVITQCVDPDSAAFLRFFILQEPITISLFLGTFMVSSGEYFTNKKN